jgi:ketosteroid isomerase-like protein
VEEFFRLVAENEEFSEFSPREFYAADDKVFVLGHYSLKVKKSGASVSAEWVHVFTLRNGKVTRFREHTDTAQFAGTASATFHSS